MKRQRIRRERAVAALAAATLLATLLTSCAANPGPPPLVAPEERPTTETTTTSSASEAAEDTPTRTQLQVGTDPVRAGFNPHLAADASAVVHDIAELVLPSPFHDGVRDKNLLVGASKLPTSPKGMTVRYVIAPEAQWSDGTPITGADFIYLWRGMTTTPGTVEPAGYRAVAGIRVSGPGGKTVDVDFAQPVADWRGMFSHLLPAHLLNPDASDFAYALRGGVPASAGRYLMENVDPVRGTITLNRNDRFWGKDPAHVEILTLNAIRDTTQAADQLRSGQLAYAEAQPNDTTSGVYGLVEGLQTRTFRGPRTLGVVFSATSGLDRQARSEGRSLIDGPLLAHIASGRSHDLDVAAPPFAPVADPAALKAVATQARPLKVAADPSEPEAAAAARSLVDLYNRQGVPARLVSADMHTITGRGLPAGDVDVAVVWLQDAGTAAAAAGRLACPPQTLRAGNLPGFCTPDNDAAARRILAGEIPLDQARQLVDETWEREALWLPLLHETRVAAYSGGIVVPPAAPAQWPGPIAQAARWRIQ